MATGFKSGGSDLDTIFAGISHSHENVVVDGDIGVTVQAHSAVLDATTASFLIDDETKLDGIETNADVTATRVDNGLDTTTGGLVVRDAVSGDYAHLTNGAIRFYYNTGASYELYNALRRRESGVANNATTVIIPGIFRSAPTIRVSPNNSITYHPAYNNQEQSSIVSANNLREDPVGTGNWKFDVSSYLTLTSNNVGFPVNEITPSVGINDPYSWREYETVATSLSLTPTEVHSPIHTLAIPNVSSITVEASAKGYHKRYGTYSWYSQYEYYWSFYGLHLKARLYVGLNGGATTNLVDTVAVSTVSSSSVPFQLNYTNVTGDEITSMKVSLALNSSTSNTRFAQYQESNNGSSGTYYPPYYPRFTTSQATGILSGESIVLSEGTVNWDAIGD